MLTHNPSRWVPSRQKQEGTAPGNTGSTGRQQAPRAASGLVGYTGEGLDLDDEPRRLAEGIYILLTHFQIYVSLYNILQGELLTRPDG